MHAGRGRGFGAYVAQMTQERQEEERIETARQLMRLNREIAVQQAELDGWLANPDNRRYAYFGDVNTANQMLQKVATTSQANPLLSTVQNKLDDLSALNKALCSDDVEDLLDCARAHLEYASPLALALGVTLAVVAVGVMVIVAHPALALLALMVFVGGCVAASVGASKIPSDRTYKLFSVARGINPEVDMEQDVLMTQSTYGNMSQ